MGFARLLVSKDWASYDALRHNADRQDAAIKKNHDVAQSLADLHDKVKNDKDKYAKLNSHMMEHGYMPQHGGNHDEEMYAPMSGNPNLDKGVDEGMKSNPVIGMPVHIVLNTKTGHTDAVTRIKPNKK